jgi:hypothetical protein
VSKRTDTTGLVLGSPCQTDKAALVVVSRRAMRVGKGLAVEGRFEGHGAHGINDLKISRMEVHAGVFSQLPLRAPNREPRGHRATAPGAHESSGVCAIGREHNRSALACGEGTLWFKYGTYERRVRGILGACRRAASGKTTHT